MPKVRSVKSRKRSVVSPLSKPKIKTKPVRKERKKGEEKSKPDKDSTVVDLTPPLIADENMKKSSAAVKALIKTVKYKYTAVADAKYAQFVTKYMRNQFEFLGIRYPVRRAVNKEIFELHPEALSHQEMHQLFYTMWEEPVRDYQGFCLDYWEKHNKVFNNNKWNDQNLAVMKHLITTKSWWDMVDEIAYKIVGGIVMSDREKYSQLMDEWIEDKNMWVRRTAILHQLNYKDKTDTVRLFNYCLKCAHEKEFFIQKSIGWALRQHFRTDPSLIKKFVEKNESKLATLSKKEALKHA